MASPLSLCVTLSYLTAVMAMEGASAASGYPFKTSRCSVSDNPNPTRILAPCLLLSGCLKRGDDCSQGSKFPYSFKGGSRKMLEHRNTYSGLEIHCIY